MFSQEMEWSRHIVYSLRRGSRIIDTLCVVLSGEKMEQTHCAFSQEGEWNRHTVCSLRSENGADTLCVLSGSWTLNKVSAPGQRSLWGCFRACVQVLLVLSGYRELRENEKKKSKSGFAEIGIT